MPMVNIKLIKSKIRHLFALSVFTIKVSVNDTLHYSQALLRPCSYTIHFTFSYTCLFFRLERSYVVSFKKRDVLRKLRVTSLFLDVLLF